MKLLGLKKMCKLVNKGGNKCKQLDLLEVYAYPKSQLTEVAQASGLHARRFTMEDGDLSTKAGQSELLSWIVLYRPKHVWLSPECGPWCAWSRFNSQRSPSKLSECPRPTESSQNTSEVLSSVSQNSDQWRPSCSHGEPLDIRALESRWFVSLCKLLSQHVSTSVCLASVILRRPKTPCRKRPPRVQTTSRAVFQELDQRICDHSHQHSQIAGRCRVHEMSIQVSKFASFYPRAFAKAIVKGILRTKDLPIEKPIYHVEEDVEEPPKRGQK